MAELKSTFQSHHSEMKSKRFVEVRGICGYIQRYVNIACDRYFITQTIQIVWAGALAMAQIAR